MNRKKRASRQHACHPGSCCCVFPTKTDSISSKYEP
ncbi:rCG59558 [Rattus norvegicus]|uniref:RCG59558 n=1 Tax=Rattus norvegicus TaxID=10116 RepID=A6HQQ5_RAT|nr:rCG59558 [Rattus norvegicus]